MRRWILAALVVTLAACEEAAPPQVSAPPVLLVAVEERDIVDRIEATGQLLARSEATVAAEVDGRVARTVVEEGVHVAEGERVIEIDPERRKLDVDSAGAQLAEAEAALEDAKRNHRRIEQLHAKGAASDSRLDQTQTELLRARARREAARAASGVADRALRDATVTAPFAGMIARRIVSRGEFVHAGTPLFDLVALDPVEVEFHVPERDSARVRAGEMVEVRVAPYPDESFHARVHVISPTIDSRTRTLAVKALLDNGDGRLRPGLFARVDLGVARRSGVAMVPEEAVLRRADGAVVFALDGEDMVSRRVIETGVHRDGLIEVVSGVAGGDWIVARGHSRLHDGIRIAPRTKDGELIERQNVAAPTEPVQ